MVVWYAASVVVSLWAMFVARLFIERVLRSTHADDYMRMGLGLLFIILLWPVIGALLFYLGRHDASLMLNKFVPALVVVGEGFYVLTALKSYRRQMWPTILIGSVALVGTAALIVQGDILRHILVF